MSSLVELIHYIVYIVEYATPRLRWLGWRRGIWQLWSIVAEAVRVHEDVLESRRERDEDILKYGPKEWTEGCELPVGVVRQGTQEDVHG